MLLSNNSNLGFKFSSTTYSAQVSLGAKENLTAEPKLVIRNKNPRPIFLCGFFILQSLTYLPQKEGEPQTMSVKMTKKFSFVLFFVVLDFLAPCFAVPLKAPSNYQSEIDLYSAARVFSLVSGVVRIGWQRMNSAFTPAVIATIVLIAVAAIGGLTVVCVRKFRSGRTAEPSEAVSSSIPTQSTGHHQRSCEGIDLEACKAANSASESSTTSTDMKEPDRSTPSGRFERALRIFSEDSEERESFPMSSRETSSQSRLWRLLIKMWRSSSRTQRRTVLPETPEPWPMPPAAVLRELQSVAA